MPAFPVVVCLFGLVSHLYALSILGCLPTIAMRLLTKIIILIAFGCFILCSALAKSNNFVVKRYVEVFKCKAGEMERTSKRMGQPQDRGNKAVVGLRGLPFQVSKEEIAQFFTGNESNSLLLLLSKVVLKRP